MTPNRLREILDAIGESYRWVARQIGAGDRAVRDWDAGKHAIPPKVGEWLEAYYENWRLLKSLNARHPPPRPPTRAEWLPGSWGGRPPVAKPKPKPTPRPTAGRGERVVQSKLTEEQVRAIRASDRGLIELGMEYGVTRQTIDHIRRRVTWGWLDD